MCIIRSRETVQTLKAGASLDTGLVPSEQRGNKSQAISGLSTNI